MATEDDRQRDSALREDIKLLAQRTYSLRRQVWMNLQRMSELINVASGAGVTASQLDSIFSDMARDIVPDALPEITMEDLIAGAKDDQAPDNTS